MNTQRELLAELENTDRRTRCLLSDLDDSQLAVPYQRGINPPLWELGHSAFFYEYFLLRKLDDNRPRMPGYDDIWDSFEIQHRERWRPGVVPDRQDTFDYYGRIIDEIRTRIETRDLPDNELYLYKYVIFHQNMHIESLIWARQILGYPAPDFAGARVDHDSDGSGRSAAGKVPLAEVSDGDVEIAGGTYPIGMPANSENFATTDFCFDNEKPGFCVDLEPFGISKTLVSNREFLAFVEDGGYTNETLWSWGGLHWLRGNEIQPSERTQHPVYWRKSPGDAGGSWQVRFFDTWTDLMLDAPVLHVSFWEAEAYCCWAGRRLPTEPEWEAAARGPEGLHFPWGHAMEKQRVDMDGRFFAHVPVNAFPDGATSGGCLQMIGSAWEWTTTQFLPYDGFAVDMYPYMSTIQFADHKVTKGGSCATSSCLIRNSYRQAYLPGRNDVFAGFRTCAR